jgi:hypothetical protein
MGSWNKQQGAARGRRPALLVTEGAEKQDAARAFDQHIRKHRALKIAQEAAAVEEAMNSNWTKPALEKKLIQFPKRNVRVSGMPQVPVVEAVQSSCKVKLGPPYTRKIISPMKSNFVSKVVLSNYLLIIRLLK